MVHTQKPTAGEVETSQSLEMDGQPESVGSGFSVKMPHERKWRSD